MKKYMIGLLIALTALVVPVFASTPDFSVRDSFVTPVNVGESIVGSVIINPLSYIPSIYNFSSINSYQVQQYDHLKWQGDATLQVTDPSNANQLVVPNGEYAFVNTGTYTIRLLNSPDQSAQIVVIAADAIQVKMSVTHEKLSFSNYPTDTFTITNESQQSVKLTVDQSDDAGNYDAIIRVWSAAKNISYTHRFEIQSDQNWSIESRTINNSLSLSTNSILDAGYVALKNIGNTDVTINCQVQGDRTSFFKIQSSQNLKRNSVTYFPIIVQIPSATQNGVYNQTLHFTGGAFTADVNVSIQITDLESPQINTWNFSDNRVYRPIVLQVIATDNVNISTVNVTTFNETRTLSKDQQLFKTTFTFANSGDYSFHICAFDSNNNRACNDTSIFIGNLSILNISQRVQAPVTKAGRVAEIPIANYTEIPPMKIPIRLRSFLIDDTPTPDFSQYTIRTLDSAGKTMSLNSIGDSVEVNTAGVLYLELRGDNTTTYSMTLDFMQPDYMGGVQTVVIDGQFKDYNVPQPFVKQWFDKNISCTADDTGVMNTSTIQCVVSYPITTDIDSITVPTSVAEKQLLDQKFAEKEKALKDRSILIFAIVGLCIGVMVVSGAVIFYLVKIQPVWRFRVDRDPKNVKKITPQEIQERQQRAFR